MKIYQSKRNGQIAHLLFEDDKQVILKLANGEDNKISIATLKRWWTFVGEEQDKVQEVVSNENTLKAEESTTKENKQVDMKNTNIIKEKITKKEMKKHIAKAEKKLNSANSELSSEDLDANKKNIEISESIESIEKFFNRKIERLDLVENKTKTKGFSTIKFEGRSILAVYKSKNAFTLWIRPKAIDETNPLISRNLYSTHNHMFGKHFMFTSLDDETMELITLLIDKSLYYQNEQNKKSKKTKNN